MAEDKEKEVTIHQTSSEKQNGIISSISQQDVQIAVISRDIQYLSTSMIELKSSITDFLKEAPNCYVSQKEFNPVRSIVYGMVGVILLAVVGALVALVITTI